MQKYHPSNWKSVPCPTRPIEFSYGKKRRAKNVEFLAFEETPLGPICLRRRELLSQPGVVVTEVTLNHEFLMSSLYTDSERALSRIAIEMHGTSVSSVNQSLNVMVAGLGLGYTAHAALQSESVARVEVIELLPQVVQWMKTGLVPLSAELVAESRLVITPGDAYQRLSGNPTADVPLFDLILIDVDHSPDDRLGDGASASFYTTKGLLSAKQHLAANGILGVWSYAESSPFVDALNECFAEVRVEPITHLNEMIHEEHTDWLFFARG